MSDHEIPPEVVDAAVASVATLEEDAESEAFREFVKRQPHLVDFVVSLSEDMGEEIEERSVDVLFRVDAIFAEASGAPVETVDAAAIQRANERTLATLEEGLREGTGEPPSAQPHVFEFVGESLSEPIEDEQGDVFEIPDDDRVDLLLAFRTVVEALDERRRGH